jgi:hypothetical protein
MLVPYKSAIFSGKITVLTLPGMPQSLKMYDKLVWRLSQTVVAKRI